MVTGQVNGTGKRLEGEIFAVVELSREIFDLREGKEEEIGEMNRDETAVVVVVW